MGTEANGEKKYTERAMKGGCQDHAIVNDVVTCAERGRDMLVGLATGRSPWPCPPHHRRGDVRGARPRPFSLRPFLFS